MSTAKRKRPSGQTSSDRAADATLASVPASGLVITVPPVSGTPGASGPLEIGRRSSPRDPTRIRVEDVLGYVVEGYLLGDLESMKTEIRVKEVGAVGYPMVMSVLSGSELLAALATDAKNNLIKTYFETFLSRIDERYADVAELAADAARHGIAHNYLSWPGVAVARGAAERHLGLEGNELILDCVMLYDDFRRSYEDHAKPAIIKDLGAAQRQFDWLTRNDLRKGMDMVARLPESRFPRKPSNWVELATPLHLRPPGGD